jgi:hypothetical protein
MRFKNKGMPPGGIRFQDPLVPSMKWDDAHTGVEERARQVIRFRLANPQIFPATDGKLFDFHQVANEIITFNCNRIGNDPNWCYDETKSQVNVGKPLAPPVEHKCPKCGCQLVPRYCKSCGGHKINGYDCPQCNKSY